MILRDKPNVTNWNAEDGYSNNNDNDTDRSYLEDYPHRIFGAGHRTGLTASLHSYEQNGDKMCNNLMGFKILVHSPADVPRLTQNFLLVPFNQEMLVAVKPNMISTSEGLRSYDPNRRGCYFKGERQLRFFKIYTQNNCELECLTNSTERRCGCVRFSFPSKNPIKSFFSFGK